MGVTSTQSGIQNVMQTDLSSYPLMCTSWREAAPLVAMNMCQIHHVKMGLGLRLAGTTGLKRRLQMCPRKHSPVLTAATNIKVNENAFSGNSKFTLLKLFLNWD